MKAINEDTKEGKLLALGESRWDQFHIESIDDHAEGNTAELILKDKMKSVTASLACIVIDKMGRTKVEDETLDDVKFWFFYLECIRLNTGFKFDLNPTLQAGPYNALVRAFFGHEVIRCGVKKLHSKIAKLEADLERCKGLLEKQKGYDRSEGQGSW